ncbi:MAG: phosphotransferase-like protein [Propionibacteriaceae bacterium]
MSALAPSRHVVILDGGSGSGKTTLAHALAEQFDEPLQLVSLDEVYPGWAGLAAGSRAVVETILDPCDPHYRRWDWAHDCVGETVELDPQAGILIEGCGALTAQSAALASYAIFLDLDAQQRKERALARDGDVFRPYWDFWAEQERAHWAQDQPQQLADLILRG